VTGGAGYIGSHACRALAAAGHQPVVLDNLSTGHRCAVQWGPFVHGDIRNAAAVAAALREHRIEAVMHFAALAYVGQSVEDPNAYYEVNVGGLLSVLAAMNATRVRKIVFSSTCAVYGAPDMVPITESTACAPINPYGRSKLMCEHILTDHAAAYGIGSVALRYFNAAGASADGAIGESHDPETHLVPLVLRAAAGLLPHVTVMGTDYSTPDGSCIRDYVHVEDLADAHLAALRHCRPGRFLPINLGTGSGVSVFEIISAARAVTGRDIPVLAGERRHGDPAILVADAARANAMLGWQARRSGLPDMIGTAWNWLCNQR